VTDTPTIENTRHLPSQTTGSEPRIRIRFNSDRGSNYTSTKFAGVLQELGIKQSVGRTGICYDNALSESVNGTLKVELVHRTVYPTRQKARDDIARWIELRYNRTRLHSTLGYRTPQEVLDEYLNGQEAA
jgi:transposase InsO family protein